MEIIDVIDVVAIYNQALSYALPFVIFFNLGNMIVNMILNAAFRGRIKVGF